ncbi:non-ribosomal peptide synthetase [Teredinibacter purpureus]|uniref:non-ribosomal peptide synthetase n=1 Tax=Teredinibacter purpureus TaxID=2731756 RepID=UPI000699050A|nr:non-ribosomal peptide synthetase [Teredinibacter purpureus]
MKFFDLLSALAESKVKVSALNGELSISAPKGAVTPELLKAVKLHKSELLEYFDRSDDKDVSIERVDRDAPLSVSFAQQRLWLVDQMGDSTAYNLAEALRLKGSLDIDAARQAFYEIVSRHESLRTCFVQGESGEPLQKIQTIDSFDITLDDLSSLDTDQQDTVARDVIKGEAGEPFDLAADIMLRVRLLRLKSDEHILLLTIHHIASDGWSMSILINEFSQLYQAYSSGQKVALPDLPVQYADYAAWQRGWLQDEVLTKQLDYWEGQLADLPVAHSVPMDYSRPNNQTFNGDTVTTQLDKTTSELLTDLCQTHGATLFMGLHSAFTAILSRYSNEKDIVVGTPTANREQAEIAPLIGFFVNTLVLRGDLSDNPTFKALLLRSKKMLLDAYENQQAPFEQIVERLKPERTLSHSPLAQILLQIQNNEKGELSIPGLTLSGIEQGYTTAKYDITLDVQENDDGIGLRWEFNTDLFKRSTIERMAKHFIGFIQQATKQPEANVFEIAFMTDQEQTAMIVDNNNTVASFPDDVCMHQLIEQQVERNPNAVAVTFENTQVSYAELNEKANQLARYLLNTRQVQPEEFVGICMERSVELVVSILAILKAGCAYVPLDPEYPEARLHYMLGDAQLRSVLTDTDLSTRIGLSDEQAVCFDNESVQRELVAFSAENVREKERTSSARQLAYMIYTSGSTGNPKGVMIEHQALVNRIHWMDREYGCSANDNILQKTPFSFDVSVWEFMWPLYSGANIVLAKPGGHKDPLYLCELIQQAGVTKLHFVPSMLGSILTVGGLEQCDSVKQVFCSGEALAIAHVEQFQQQCPTAQLHNLYGPTEAAIDVSAWDCAQYSLEGIDNNSEKLSSIPIGKPIQNTQLLVLDDYLKPVPQGAAGELHIGGVGLARGYWNRSDLTDEKFVNNPYRQEHTTHSAKLYKTGDLARWLPSGNLEYLGRLDHQVKIRGFRIELGDIENTLADHEHVNSVVVVACATASGDKQLVAYVACTPEFRDATETSEAPSLAETLRLHLLQKLPEYMVPANIMVLDELPITPNGKVNRSALPEPDLARASVPYVAPRNETETALCELWQSLLKHDEIGINDSFFELGGNSLTTVHLVQLLKKNGFNAAIKDIYEHSTIATLGPFCEQNRLEDVIADDSMLVKEGVVYPLAPNRHWYLMRTESLLGWGQSMVMQFHDNLDYSDIVQATTEYLVQKHRGLRIQFLQGNNAWQERIAPLNAVEYFEVDYVEDQLPPGLQNEVRDGLLEYQEKITFDRLFQVSYRRVDGDKADQVVLSLHHMLYDAFSLGVIMSDFVEAFMRVQLGSLPTECVGYVGVPEWVADTQKWVKSDASSSSKSFWTGFDCTPYKILPTDKPFSETLNCMSSTRYISERLSNAESEKLLSIVEDHEGLSVFDLLITAVTEAFGQWTGNRALSIEIPNSNRLSLTGELDLVGGIGWFIDYSPLYIDMGSVGYGVEAVNHVANMCKQCLTRGEGFNALKHFADDQLLADKMATFPYPEVHLNYLPPELNGGGTVAGEAENPANFSIISQKNFDGETRERVHKFSGTMEFVDNGFVIRWEYSKNIYDKSTIEMLTAACKQQLLRLVDELQVGRLQLSA